MVYVDSAFLPFRRMLMCHLIADTEAELEAMAKTIGIQLKWWQYKGTYKSHFDICKTKRELAIKAGAIEITQQQLAGILKGKRNNATPI